MRLTVRELGGVGWATTELVNARSLIERNPAALRLLATAPDDSPLAMQLFGTDPAEMRDAAFICEQLGAAAVDLNMGCPVHKVVKTGAGAAMMNDIPAAAALVRGVVAAVKKIPVTVKMRLGWDSGHVNAPALAAALADAGVAALCVHGRTRAQGYSGGVNLAGIRETVRAAGNIPVIGNGDVTTPEAAKRMLDETGCAGVAIGRGALYDPWIFQRTAVWLEGGALPPEPDFNERLRVMRRHLVRHCEFYGEAAGMRRFLTAAQWYSRRFGPAKFFRQNIERAASIAEFDALVADYIGWRRTFCDADGNLLPKHAPQTHAHSSPATTSP